LSTSGFNSTLRARCPLPTECQKPRVIYRNAS
jgi:hypothetical protein